MKIDLARTRSQALSGILGLFLILTGALAPGCGPASSSSQESPAPIALLQARGDDLLLKLESGESTGARLWSNGYSSRHWGIVFVSGVNGGFEEPADELYSRMAVEFSEAGVPSIFVRFRYPGLIEESVSDARAAIRYFTEQGISRLAIVGWSFGGAVAIQAAAAAPEIATVVTLSAQSQDTEPVSSFRKQSLLVIHSEDDENVPSYAAEQIIDEAPASIHKELIYIRGYDHLLDGASEEVDPLFRSWVMKELAG